MKVLVTGSKGFIGKNLIAELKNRKNCQIFEYSRDTDPLLLDQYCKEANFVFHLAGVNRPNNPSEFMEGNFGFTEELLNNLKKHNNTCPVLYSSSIQSTSNNPYGYSKKAGEDLLLNYGKETESDIYIYRLPNVFGKWSKPNYNSAVATFCYNISRNLKINVNDPKKVINLAYIDDVVSEFIGMLKSQKNEKSQFCKLSHIYTSTLGEIVDLLFLFSKSREEKTVPNTSDEFTKKLYSTYLSFLPKEKFSYELKMNTDERGSFTEFIKTPERGQVSVNVSKPGIIKGNHWHHTKNEKFLVVSGKGVIRFRSIYSAEVLEYFVSSEKLEVVDIPTGYTHNIENIGNTDMVTIMWVNELFNPEQPDTYMMDV